MGTPVCIVISRRGADWVHTACGCILYSQAAFIHALGDMLQSVGVMIAAVVIW